MLRYQNYQLNTSFNVSGFYKTGSFTQLQFRASQLDLEIRVNLGTTARLMLLSQFVPHIFLSVASGKSVL